MRKAVLSLALWSSCALSLAQDAGGRPSAVRDKEKVLAIIEALETDPLGPRSKDLRAALLYWLTEVPDLTVVLCPDVLGEMDKFGKYEGELTTQLSFSQAGFLLRNPSGDPRSVPAQLAGAVGTLRAYQAMLKADPKARSKVLDELLQKQENGDLEAHVTKGWKVCEARR
jgi:hypothetical protein